MTSPTLLRRLFRRHSPLFKQLPTLAAWLIALALVMSVPEVAVTNLSLVSIGSVLILTATVAAVWMGARQRYESNLVMLIPVVDLLGFGLFRAGTGGVNSLFGSLILLPIVWLAMAPGKRYVALIAVLSSLNYLLPYFATPPNTWVEWLRAVIAPLVFAGVAWVINGLAGQQRRKVEESERLVVELTRALEFNKEMIEQLQESKKENHALLASFKSLWASITAQAILATDTCGKIAAWTQGAENLFGLGEEQVLGTVSVDSFFTPSALKTLVDEFPPAGVSLTGIAREDADDPSELPDGIRALFAAAEATSTIQTNLDVIAAGGSVVPTRVSITQRRDGDGRQLGYLLVITDESRAVEVARMKDQFVGMVSHELRTPLTSIIGFLDLLQSDPEQPLSEDQLNFVEVIDRNANRLLALVGDLLFTAQVESGTFPLSLKEFDLTNGIDVALRSAEPTALRVGVELKSEVPNEPIMIGADPTRIGQVLDNLLSNAIKFTPQGGSVTVGARTAGEDVELWVRDTGLGIPKDEQTQLFTRFFRASTATRHAVPGIGLGLSIVRAIVTAHGGKMAVVSTEGDGAEFKISLPRAVALV